MVAGGSRVFLLVGERVQILFALCLVFGKFAVAGSMTQWEMLKIIWSCGCLVPNARLEALCYVRMLTGWSTAAQPPRMWPEPFRHSRTWASGLFPPLPSSLLNCEGTQAYRPPRVRGPRSPRVYPPAGWAPHRLTGIASKCPAPVVPAMPQ